MPLERGRHQRPTFPPRTCSLLRHGQKEAPDSRAELRREPIKLQRKRPVRAHGRRLATAHHIDLVHVFSDPLPGTWFFNVVKESLRGAKIREAMSVPPNRGHGPPSHRTRAATHSDPPRFVRKRGRSITLLGALGLVPDVVGDGRGRHGEARFADRRCSYD